MKKPLHTSGIADRFLLMCRLVLPAIVVLGATAAAAQQNSLVGQWRGVFQGITITIVIQSNGQYTTTTRSATVMTEQDGQYNLFAPSTIIFSVTNWAPRTMPVYHAYPSGGGYYTQEPTTMPPGGTDTYVFKGANTVILTDQMMHGSVTMTRVP